MVTKKQYKVLGLFFTRGISLKRWVDSGLFTREKLIYESHLSMKTFDKIYWFTYGSNDIELSKRLKDENQLNKNIEIVHMPKFLNIPKIGSFIYSILMPFIKYKEIKKCTILKTNQMDGSWSAVLAKIIYKKPLYLRTGWTVTQFWKKEDKNIFRVKLYEYFEKLAYKFADAKAVSSQHDKKYLEHEYQVNNLNVLPNFIDIDLFNDKQYDRENKIIFVGRLNKQKNLFALINAISKTNLILDIYGDGELKDELVLYSKKLNSQVNFKGLVSNKELSEIYNRYKFFILPSLYEGMPKTLLEAMSSGCICIGTDVAGINEVIDTNNGFLIDFNFDGNTIEDILSISDDKLQQIKGNAIQHIQNNFSLESIIQKEIQIFNEVEHSNG